MRKKNIKLISYGNFEKEFLNLIAEAVYDEFNIPVIIKNKYIDLSSFYDPARKQYNGNLILKEIDSDISFKSFKKIGLFKVDLFIPILTYIFGQAFLNGSTGIASVFRLKNEYYGLKSDESLLIERFSKEVIHELGHTFGLKHCFVPTCVMLSSTYVEDIDQKSSSFCIKCKSELESNIKNL